MRTRTTYGKIMTTKWTSARIRSSDEYPRLMKHWRWTTGWSRFWSISTPPWSLIKSPPAWISRRPATRSSCSTFSMWGAAAGRTSKSGSSRMLSMWLPLISARSAWSSTKAGGIMRDAPSDSTWWPTTSPSPPCCLSSVTPIMIWWLLNFASITCLARKKISARASPTYSNPSWWADTS